MKNLGIVIGVSSYQTVGNLPACQRDSEAAAALLNDSGKFADVLILNTVTDSASVKTKLSEFVKLHQGSEISDVVFYFSGHGDFSGSDFAFVLSDYDEDRRNKTTLSNGELDGLVRSLKPRTFVKIVDACQSGITYIKESDSLPEYLKSAHGSFSNVYFMFSSKNDQSSYATQHISYFTRALLESVVGRPDGSVRYKDIMDGIADAFSGGDGKQTPYFVVQADLTEELCDLTPSLRDSLSVFLSIPNAPPSAGGPQKRQAPPSLRERVQDAAKDYVQREDAEKRLAEIPPMITEKFLSTEVASLYTISVSEHTDDVPNPASIGSWLEQNPEDPNYFARPTKDTRKVTKRVPKRRGGLLNIDSLRSFYGYEDDDYKEIEVYESFTDGFKHTSTMPFSYILVRLDPKHPNLNPEECYIVPVVSNSRIRIFYAFSHFTKVDFDKTVRGKMSKWATISALTRSKPELKGILEQALKSFSDYVEEPLKKKFSVDADTDTDAETEEPKDVTDGSPSNESKA